MAGRCNDRTPVAVLSLFTRLRFLLSRGQDIGGAMVMMPCPQCEGYRVGEEARRVTLGQKHIGHIGHMTIAELRGFLNTVPAHQSLSAFGHNLIREVLRKTHDLVQVGLGHLTPYRPMPTLSGGEIQRIFLTSHLDSMMDSLIYVLDEPTVGLHEIEKADLLEQIEALRALGNSVIVVEHDRNTIERAQHVIDIGPLAGSGGGEVVYEGDYVGLLESERSVTGQYLSGRRAVPRKAPHEYATVTDATARLTLHHVMTNNLKDVTADFPLGVLVGVAGVSGSGKSSLVSGTLIPLLETSLCGPATGRTHRLERRRGCRLRRAQSRCCENRRTGKHRRVFPGLSSANRSAEYFQPCLLRQYLGKRQEAVR